MQAPERNSNCSNLFDALWKLGIIHLRQGKVVVDENVLEAWKLISEAAKNREATIDAYPNEGPEVVTMALTVCGFIISATGQQEFSTEEFKTHAEMAKILLKIKSGWQVPDEVVSKLLKSAFYNRAKNSVLFTIFAGSLAATLFSSLSIASFLMVLTPLVFGAVTQRPRGAYSLAGYYLTLTFIISRLTGGPLQFNLLFEFAVIAVGVLIAYFANILKTTVYQALT